MNYKDMFARALAGVALVIAIVALFTPTGRSTVEHLVGSTTNYSTLSASALQIGSGCDNSFSTCTGTSVSQINKGTCTILADASVAATSTANFDCAFTGVQSGDTVFVTQQASSTIATQYEIKGATASTTNGWITFSILNLRGVAAVPSATPGFGSSTQVLILR